MIIEFLYLNGYKMTDFSYVRTEAGIILLLRKIISLLNNQVYDKWNKIEKDLIKDENADNYLFAKEIFVRDPEAFKDKDHDGIDDIIDKNIK